MPAMRGLLTAVLLVAATAEGAAPIPFNDGFETGDLSRWDATWEPAAANSLSVTGAAAHDGLVGLRLVDNDNSSAEQGQNSVGSAIPVSNTLFIRAWIRVTSPAGPGAWQVMRLANSSSMPLLSLTLGAQSRSIGVGHRHPTLGYESGTSTATYVPGRWALYEMYGEGARTDGGLGRLFIDGVERHRVLITDWSGSNAADGMNLGGIFSSQNQTGTLDFDDFRLARAPLPSTVRVAVPSGPYLAGACLAIAVRAGTSLGDVVDPPAYELPISFALDGGAALFRDSQCQTPAGPSRLGADAGMVQVFLRAADAGAVFLAVRSPDLIEGNAAFVFTAADAGSDAGVDGGFDAGAGGGADGGTDAGADAGTAGSPDAGADAGTPGSPDAGADAGADAGTPGSPDAGADAGATDIVDSGAVVTPVAALSPTQVEMDQGRTVALSAAASRVGANAQPPMYLWSLVRGPTGVKFVEGPEQSLTLFAPGRYEVELTVLDAHGQRSAPVRSMVVVAGEDELPTGALHGCSAADGSLFASGSALGLLALLARSRRRR